jgi:hypothetical protein
MQWHLHHPHASKASGIVLIGFMLFYDTRRSNSDRVVAELANERFCPPRPTAVSGPLNELRQAFVDRTLEVSMHAAGKAITGGAYAKTTPDKPPAHDAKAKKAA